MIGEVETGKATVLIKLLEHAVFKNVTSIPDPASLLVSTPIGDVLGPLVMFNIIFAEVLAWYVDEEVVVDPT